MNQLLAEYWPMILIALAIGLVVGWLAFRPRQRVALSDSTPLRPHMTTARTGEGRGIADEAAAAASDVAGQVLGTRVHAELPGASGAPDDLKLLKGVGPKLATMLNERGILRFDQLARMSPSQVEALDVSLGAFRGRFARDRIVEQAAFLARGDSDGFEQQFGKL